MKEIFLRKLNDLIIILIFGTAIFIPFSLGIWESDVAVSEIEKRQLAELPKTIEDINKFPKLFDNYYADHFGLRHWFTEYYKLVKYTIGDSPSQDVSIGKNGWLFLGSTKQGYNKYNDPMGDVRNINLFAPEELTRLVDYMVNLKNWLKQKGIEYVFVIAPNKHTIYFDQLPNYVAKVNPRSAMDQLLDYLTKHTNIPVIDLRPALLAEKSKHQIYFKTDTHWNHYAANIAQYEIMLEIAKIFPNQIQPEIKQLQEITKSGGDLANFMGVTFQGEPFPQPIFEQTCEPVRYPKDARGRATHNFTCENQQLNTIIFRDSFFSALQPYFARKFKHSTYIWKRLNYSDLMKYIELEQPDIIIEEMVERSLPYLPSNTEFMHYITIPKPIFKSDNL